MASSSSSTTTTTTQGNYDVFVSSRKNDAYDIILSLLQVRKIGVVTGGDFERREEDEEISDAILQTIEESKICLVIFSKNYASSTYCLDELVKILQCQKIYGQTVRPIFFRVDPSDLSCQSGSFARALAKHEGHPNLQKWKKTLREVASISSRDTKFTGPEYQLIDCLVKDIRNTLNSVSISFKKKNSISISSFRDTKFDNKDSMVGIDSRLRQLKWLLEEGIYNEHFSVIGLSGMGGIGKSTLAAGLFNQLLPNFEGHCFLANVREESRRHGLENLRQELYMELFKDTGLDFKQMMFKYHDKKVLIVLDDVSNSEHIESLAGRFFGCPRGSTIILTSRNRELLRKHTDKIYEVEELDYREALCLLSRHAFKQERPPIGSDYKELVYRVINLAKGNPLSLKILGSYLCGRRLQEQESAFSKVEELLWKQALPRSFLPPTRRFRRS